MSKINSSVIKDYLPIIIMIIGAFFAFKFFKGMFGNPVNDTKKTNDSNFSAATETLKDQIVNSSNCKISEEQAVIYADQIHNAMDGYGTEKNIILNILDLLNDEEKELVYIKFGKRPYAAGGVGTPTGVLAMLGMYTDLDMLGWFERETRGALLKSLKKHFETTQFNF